MTIFWVELNGTMITMGNRECLLLVARDITERKEADEKIRASLYMQAAKTEHPGARSALKESRARVKSIARVHERLYKPSDLASVDMGEYVRSLVSDLEYSYGATDSSVRLTVKVGDISLGITEAIPCGLIINELVSNSLKYAFPHGQEGKIVVQLPRNTQNRTVLTVTDSGIGLPEQVDFQNSFSLGLILVRSLVEQLGSTIKLDRSGEQPLWSPLADQGLLMHSFLR